MSRTLRLALLALACTVDLSWASAFTGEGSRGESGEGASSGLRRTLVTAGTLAG